MKTMTHLRVILALCLLGLLAASIAEDMTEVKIRGTHKHVLLSRDQRWGEYNTNILEYEYDYFEHA